MPTGAGAGIPVEPEHGVTATMRRVSTDVAAAFGAGALAGLGVALPLGAIGVLIVQEGISGGWRPAFAAGTGVALVDGAYAALAVAAGAAVTGVLTGRERAVQLVGAVVLVAVAVRGLLALRRPAEPGAAVPHSRVLRRFVGLTAINPTTAVYFVVLTTGLRRRTSSPARPPGRRSRSASCSPPAPGS